MSVLYLLLYLLAGLFCVRCLLPSRRPTVRVWLGLCAGVFLLMWLPSLCAFFLRFSRAAHYMALAPLAAVCGLSFLLRDRRDAARWDETETKTAWMLALVVLPLTAFSAYLQITHNLQPLSGGLYVGQSTYGDLPLHASIITGLQDAVYPPDYTVMAGELLCYPFLTDALSASLYLFGMNLQAAMNVPGILMSGLVYAGFLLLARGLTKSKAAPVLAVLFFFIGGGLGFLLYDFDMAGSGWQEALANIMRGYYQTPTNRPADNLRWSNVICDMMLPQRTTLGGWTILLPCLYLLLEPLCAARPPEKREWALLTVLAGGLPMIHTHSFLALGLCSAGVMAYTLIESRGGARVALLKRFLCYGAGTVALALPQLLTWTFRQSLSSTDFLRLWVNWVNTADGTPGTAKDLYLWFYVKNIGLPLLLLLPALLEKNRGARLLACGAFLIFIPAELIRFQTNVYDNNKLFYVWYMLCAVIEADYAAALYARLRGMRGRAVLAAVFLFVSLTGGVLTCAREAVSCYCAFDRDSVDVSEWVKGNTAQDDLFLTGTQHLNPVSSLAGRHIVCGPDLWLYYHGYDTGERQADIARFYVSPLDTLSVLDKYSVDYVMVGEYEKNDYDVAEDVLRQILTPVYEKNGTVIFRVPDDMKAEGGG